MSDSQLRILTLPGWNGSGPEHWQSRWEQQHGFQRVEQHDWQQPLRGDWMIQMEEAVLSSETPVVLVAHSLGCHLVAAWAAHSRQAHKVQAALLVAPADLDIFLLQSLHSWHNMVLQPLPFASTVLASSDDVWCSLERAAWMASAWGSTLVDIGPCGHINSESGLGDWPQGLQQLQDLIARSTPVA
ncbi:RBBP9/YdeN family alpha/beta hydrolase [Brachymonas denitrificans]|uniref:RBBP9/YdeN family alpha/beta hydrolase n=1 Tax=Brachymonas denitrificans TaxID=28220 RepID=UPI00321FBD73